MKLRPRRRPLIVCPIDQTPFRTLTEFWRHCEKKHDERMDKEGDFLLQERLRADHKKKIRKLIREQGRR